MTHSHPFLTKERIAHSVLCNELESAILFDSVHQHFKSKYQRVNFLFKELGLNKTNRMRMMVKFVDSVEHIHFDIQNKFNKPYDMLFIEYANQLLMEAFEIVEGQNVAK